jgi:hypothetical protein
MVRNPLPTSFNSGMSLQALMALLGHVSTEMTLRYAALAAPAVRTAYEEAMGKARARLTLAIAPVGQPIIPGRVEWLRAEMLKTRVAHGYCSRQLAAEACPYANICEQCDNYVTAPEFIPQLQAQLADVTALRDDAAGRGWHTEVARHSRVIASLQAHLHRLKRNQEPDIKGDTSQSRLIEAQFGPLRTFVMGNSDHPHHAALTRRLQAYLRWRDANARHPDVLAAQRRERARIRSERQQRWGRPRTQAA